MTYKNKLIEILKADEKVKDYLENSWHPMYDINIKVIPLEERFLRIYCENNNKRSFITSEGNLCEIRIQNSNMKIFKKELEVRGETEIKTNMIIITQLNNNRTFDNQSEEVYKQICEFIETITK